MKFQEFSGVHDLQNAFPSEQVCIDYLTSIRWAAGVVSPFDASSKVYKCNGNKYRCKESKKYFTIRTGTIFADSKIPLVKWLMAIYLFSTHGKGISSVQIAKHLDIRQKAAWFMLHRIRFAMSHRGMFEFPLGGVIESDTTFLGGKEENRHESKKTGLKTKDKAAVVGLVQRGGRVIMRYVPKHSSLQVVPLLAANLYYGATLMTDEGHEFAGASERFNHQTVNHSSKEYVRGEVHTNTIEGLWSNLKRGMYGTYHFCTKKHVQAYLDEFSFRYNRRKQSNYTRFNDFFEFANKGSLKYNDLIQKGKEAKA